jgi:hypothetical protein
MVTIMFGIVFLIPILHREHIETNSVDAFLFGLAEGNAKKNSWEKRKIMFVRNQPTTTTTATTRHIENINFDAFCLLRITIRFLYLIHIINMHFCVTYDIKTKCMEANGNMYRYL